MKAMSPENASTILHYAVAVARNEQKTTAKTIAAANPEGLAYKPSERCMSGAELIWHLASSEVAILNGAANGAFDFSGGRPENTETPEQIAAWYTENASKALDRCAALNGEAAAKVVSFMGVFEQPAVGYVTMATNHAIHHRGQLSSYLRPMGGKVPAIYGMSADDNPFEKKG